MNISNDEEALMKELGITSQTVTAYLCDGYTYSKLQDAVKYAQIKAETKDPAPTVPLLKNWI